MLSRQTLLLRSCVSWYNENPSAARQLAAIINRDTTKTPPISLRVIEYFLHTYVRNHTHMDMGKYNGDEIIYWHNRFQKTYGKANFDVFCRSKKTQFKLGGVTIQSNASQLEFFRWAITFGILDAITDNIHDIVKQKRTQQASLERVPSSTVASVPTNNKVAKGAPRFWFDKPFKTLLSSDGSETVRADKT